MLTVGSLFSGVGGLDLGLERAGMTVKWQAEVDPYCSRVLAKHWPHVSNLGDVTMIDWNEVERVELVCGGFPCQPVSYAGKRLAQDDDRWLWPEVVRCLRVLRPRFALMENVPGLLTAGFGDVAADLADCGYDFEWDCIPASAVGAPHLRYRVFILAHARCVGGERRGEPGQLAGASGAGEGEAPERQRVRDAAGDRGAPGADPDGGRLEERGERDGGTSGPRLGASCGHDAGGLCADVADADRAGLSVFRGSAARAELARLGATHGAGWWESEPAVGRVVDELPRRVDRLRSLGNAVVPQVAEFIGRQLLASLT